MDTVTATRRFFLKQLASLSAMLTLPITARNVQAAGKTALTDVRVSNSSKDHTRVVFDLSGSTDHSLFTLSSPNRVVIDLKGVRKSAALVSDEHQTKLLKGIRSAVRQNSDLRIVLDLNTKVRPRSFVLKPDTQLGHRLVVDMHATQLSPTPIKTSRQNRNRQKKPQVKTTY